MTGSKTKRVWTVAEAKAKLSEILRLAETEGPQRIGVRRSFILIPAKLWEAKEPPKKPMGQWLLENMSRAGEFEISRNRESKREIPFIEDDTEHNGT